MITVFPLINYVLTDVEKVSLRLVFVVFLVFGFFWFFGCFFFF